MATKNKIVPDSDARNTVVLPELPADTPLPLGYVAQQVASRELVRLRSVVARLEREISNGGVGAQGQVVPYLVERNRELREDVEKVRAEIKAIEGLDDYRVRVWAYRRGYR